MFSIYSSPSGHPSASLSTPNCSGKGVSTWSTGAQTKRLQGVHLEKQGAKGENQGVDRENHVVEKRVKELKRKLNTA